MVVKSGIISYNKSFLSSVSIFLKFKNYANCFTVAHGVRGQHREIKFLESIQNLKGFGSQILRRARLADRWGKYCLFFFLKIIPTLADRFKTHSQATAPTKRKIENLAPLDRNREILKHTLTSLTPIISPLYQLILKAVKFEACSLKLL